MASEGPVNVAEKPESLYKIVVKNLKPAHLSSDIIETQQWIHLNENIPRIMMSHPPLHSLEQLYRCVEIICANGKSESTYKALESLLDENCRKIERHLTENVRDAEFLKETAKHWKDFCKHLLTIRNIYLHLDRNYVLQNPPLLSVWNLGVTCFRKIVLSNAQIMAKIDENLIREIGRERIGKTIDRNLLKCVTSMLSAAQLYAESFERIYIATSKKFYAIASKDSIEQRSVPDYLLEIQKRMDEENRRAANYLQPSTQTHITKVLEDEMISAHYKRIMSGFQKMLDDNEIAQLKLLDALFARIYGGTDLLNSEFMLHVTKTVKDIVQPKNDPNMVQDLLEFKDKADNIAREAFKTEGMLGYVRKAFKKSINTRANKPAELIAKYLDAKLRTGNKTATDEEMEATLEKLLVLFRLVNGKDVFKAFYKKDLAKRLLLGKSANVDYEKSMLSKLKEECGPGFTCKLEGMFSDIHVSKDINIVFKQYLQQQQQQHRKIDFSVNVLTAGNWPTYKTYEAQIPAEMNHLQAVFAKFYVDKHQGRRLRWQPSLGQCILKAAFGGAKKELQVSLFQAIILLLFNDADALTFAEIRNAVNLDAAELRPLLQSLACGKARVLCKHPRSKDVADDDAFAYNAKFADPLFRIKINQLQIKETPEEQKDTEKSVFQDRQYQVDAAIVRIMKHKRTLKHNVLISELFAELEFPVKPADLKVRIESLIERDYIGRDDTDASQYYYIS